MNVITIHSWIKKKYIQCLNGLRTELIHITIWERVKFAIQTWADVNNLEVRIENLEFE